MYNNYNNNKNRNDNVIACNSGVTFPNYIYIKILSYLIPMGFLPTFCQSHYDSIPLENYFKLLLVCKNWQSNIVPKLKLRLSFNVVSGSYHYDYLIEYLMNHQFNVEFNLLTIPENLLNWRIQDHVIESTMTSTNIHEYMHLFKRLEVLNYIDNHSTLVSLSKDNIDLPDTLKLLNYSFIGDTNPDVNIKALFERLMKISRFSRLNLYSNLSSVLVFKEFDSITLLSNQLKSLSVSVLRSNSVIIDSICKLFKLKSLTLQLTLDDSLDPNYILAQLIHLTQLKSLDVILNNKNNIRLLQSSILNFVNSFTSLKQLFISWNLNVLNDCNDGDCRITNTTLKEIEMNCDGNNILFNYINLWSQPSALTSITLQNLENENIPELLMKHPKITKLICHSNSIRGIPLISCDHPTLRTLIIQFSKFENIFNQLNLNASITCLDISISYQSTLFDFLKLNHPTIQSLTCRSERINLQKLLSSLILNHSITSIECISRVHNPLKDKITLNNLINYLIAVFRVNSPIVSLKLPEYKITFDGQFTYDHNQFKKLYQLIHNSNLKLINFPMVISHIELKSIFSKHNIQTNLTSNY